MKKFLFLLAWVEGSDSADEDTGVHQQSDLLPQYQAGNEHVFALVINVPNSGNETDIAATYGYAAAFHDNYTGYDTVSVCLENADEFEIQEDTEEIFVNI